MLINNKVTWFRVWFILIVVLALGLRVWHLSSTPPSPYWEEVALGYDAYSLLKTGKDHHGNNWPIVAVESFGDWKPAGYVYALIPFVAVMGLSVTTVRLPAALAGVLVVVGVGWLARLLGRWWEEKSESKVKQHVTNLTFPEQWQLVAMAVTAVSPWAIVFSRAAWEVNLATCLVVWGVGAGWKSWLSASQKQQASSNDVKWMAISGVLLVLAMYTYHAARIISPLLGLVLGLVWIWISWPGKEWFKSIRRWVLAVVPAVILLIPLLLALGSPVTSQRFAETSIFSDITVIERSNGLQALAGQGWWSKLLYHRYVLFGQEILHNFFSHFTFQFLFLTGDANPRHSIQFLGQLYPFEALFLAIGVVWLVTRPRRSSWFLWWWLVVGVFPAAITLAAPHALRTLFVMPLFMLLISGGIVQLGRWWAVVVKKWQRPIVGRWLLRVGVVGIYVIGVCIFWRFYSSVYPKLYADQWQQGYENMIRQVAAFREANPAIPIFITREQGRPAMYYWFFTKTDPTRVQAADETAKKDQGEFLEFENITFVRSVDEVTNVGLVVSSSEQAQVLKSKYHTTSQFEVLDYQNRPIWTVQLLD